MTDQFGDAAVVQSHIRQSRTRIGRSTRLIALSQSAIDRSREAIRSSHAVLVSKAHEPARDAAVGAVLTDFDPATMESVVEDFSSAYLEAVATGDEETAGIVRKALLILGRHLANDVGPRAGGVWIN